MARRVDDDDDDDYDDDEDDDDRPRPKKTASKKSKGGGFDFMAVLLFRQSIGLLVVNALFWVGIVYCLTQAGSNLYTAISMGSDAFGDAPPQAVAAMGMMGIKSRTSLFGWGTFYLLGGPIIVRALCDALAQVFRNGETLSAIKKSLDKDG